ncbi:MAG: hypothetical protein EA376_00025 [Phycisphaeraceae bacterium]|nr:MAG: hypothetical protein EA376_00025 [Phycisphaeraceae bacterium]
MSAGRQIILPDGTRGVTSAGRVAVADAQGNCPGCCLELELCGCRCPESWPSSGCGLVYGRCRGPVPPPVPFAFGVASVSSTVLWSSQGVDTIFSVSASNAVMEVTTARCAWIPDQEASPLFTDDLLEGEVILPASCSGSFRGDCPDPWVRFRAFWRSTGAAQYLECRFAGAQGCVPVGFTSCFSSVHPSAVFISDFSDPGGLTGCYGNPGGSTIEVCEINTSGDCKTTMNATMVWERPEVGASNPYRREETTISLDITYPIASCGSMQEFEL